MRRVKVRRWPLDKIKDWLSRVLRHLLVTERNSSTNTVQTRDALHTRSIFLLLSSINIYIFFSQDVFTWQIIWDKILCCLLVSWKKYQELILLVNYSTVTVYKMKTGVSVCFVTGRGRQSITVIMKNHDTQSETILIHHTLVSPTNHT